MSDVVKLSLGEVRGWLERETRSVFVPVHSKAQRFCAEMDKVLGYLDEVSKMLLDNSGKEIEKRNMKVYGRARALNKLSRLFIDRLRQVKVPDNVSYDSLSVLAQDAQKAFLATEVDVRNWFPRISPFFILDHRKFLAVFEKAKGTLEELGRFVTKEYVKTKLLEDTFKLLEKLQMLEQQVSVLREQESKAQAELALIEKEIVERQRRIDGLKSGGSLGQLAGVEAEIEALSTELKQNLQHLQKPFIKLQSLALRGGGSGLIQDESKKLNEYLENPFEAFATERAGYPLLRGVLQKLDQSMFEKLNVKPEKERKAKQAIDSIIGKNALEGLHKKCVDAVARKTHLSTSAETARVQAQLSILRGQLDELERRKRNAESERLMAERARNETSEKIKVGKNTVEKNVFDFLVKKVQIE